MLPLFGMDNQGGHGVVHKVWSETFDLIPSTIGLTRKIPKTNDEQKTCKQHFVKVLVCPCKHPSVIKSKNFLLLTIEINKIHKFNIPRLNYGHFPKKTKSNPH
jgi:hypothetical protein